MTRGILAIDLGTTSLKCILVDGSGATVDRESANQESSPLVQTWIAHLVSVVRVLRGRNPDIGIEKLSLSRSAKCSRR